MCTCETTTCPPRLHGRSDSFPGVHGKPAEAPLSPATDISSIVGNRELPANCRHSKTQPRVATLVRSPLIVGPSLTGPQRLNRALVNAVSGPTQSGPCIRSWPADCRSGTRRFAGDRMSRAAISALLPPSEMSFSTSASRAVTPSAASRGATVPGPDRGLLAPSKRGANLVLKGQFADGCAVGVRLPQPRFGTTVAEGELAAQLPHQIRGAVMPAGPPDAS